MTNPLNAAVRLVLPAPAAAEPVRAGRGGGRAFSEALADVAGVARDLATEKVSIASEMRRIVASGDTSQMPKVYARLLDTNVRQDVMATVLTKTTTGVDQLVKMQ